MRPTYLGRTTTILILGSFAIGATALVSMFFLDSNPQTLQTAMNWGYLTVAVVTGTWLHSRRAEALAKVQKRATTGEEIEAYFE